MSIKEELLRQKKEIDEALQAIAAKEREEEELAEKEAMMANGLFIPLRYAIVKEDIYWCSGDERIQSHGYGTARRFLRGPSFESGDSLVLIKDSTNQLIWVPFQENGDYTESEDDSHIPNDKIYDMLELLPEGIQITS